MTRNKSPEQLILQYPFIEFGISGMPYMGFTFCLENVLTPLAFILLYVF